MSDEKTFYVHMSQDWVYEVRADSMNDAQRIVEEGDAGPGECTGYSIEAITLDPLGLDDQRPPNPCRGGCGKHLPACLDDQCLDCFLRSLNERNSVASGVGAGNPNG